MITKPKYKESWDTGTYGKFIPVCKGKLNQFMFVIEAHVHIDAYKGEIFEAYKPDLLQVYHDRSLLNLCDTIVKDIVQRQIYRKLEIGELIWMV